MNIFTTLLEKWKQMWCEHENFVGFWRGDFKCTECGKIKKITL